MSETRTTGTEHIVQSGGAVLINPPSRRVIRRRRTPRPVGTSTLAFAMMRDMRARLQFMKALAIKHLAPAIVKATGIVEAQVRTDAPVDEISSAMGDFRAVFFRERTPEELENTIRNHGHKVNRRTRSTFQRQFKAVMGVDVLASEPWLGDEIREFTAENVSLITGLEEETLKDIEQTIIRRVRAGDSPSRIASQLAAQFDVSGSRAQLIARDQTLKFHSRLLRLRYEGQGLKRYRWRTVKDQRVRDRHEALEGKVFSFKNPPVTVTSGKRSGERNNPGEDIQCRCYAEPIFEDLLGRVA